MNAVVLSWPPTFCRFAKAGIFSTKLH
jgi:hypothetical protein